MNTDDRAIPRMNENSKVITSELIELTSDLQEPEEKLDLAEAKEKLDLMDTLISLQEMLLVAANDSKQINQAKKEIQEKNLGEIKDMHEDVNGVLETINKMQSL